jgi:hypothetical protein
MIGHIGMDVLLLPMMPQCVGKEPCRYDVHPVIKWLSRFLPIDPWIDGEKPLFEDMNKDKAYRIGNRLYVGMSVWNELSKLKTLEVSK